MFVSSVDRSDPNKNIIFEIAPNGTLMGVFAQMTDGLSSLKFNINPTAILVPPGPGQSFLSGLIAGSGISSVGGTFAALYFQPSSYSPGQVISNSTLPTGVTQTDLGEPVIAEVLNILGNGRGDRRRDRPDRRSDRGRTPTIAQPILLDLHRFRHAARRRHPGDARLQRRPGLRRQALDRRRRHADQPRRRAGIGSTTWLGAVTTPFRRF